MTVSFVGFSATVVCSAVGQHLMKKKGKEDLADTLHVLTIGGAAAYSLYFVWKLVSFSAGIFL